MTVRERSCNGCGAPLGATDCQCSYCRLSVAAAPSLLGYWATEDGLTPIHNAGSLYALQAQAGYFPAAGGGGGGAATSSFQHQTGGGGGMVNVLSGFFGYAAAQCGNGRLR